MKILFLTKTGESLSIPFCFGYDSQRTKSPSLSPILSSLDSDGDDPGGIALV